MSLKKDNQNSKINNKIKIDQKIILNYKVNNVNNKCNDFLINKLNSIRYILSYNDYIESFVIMFDKKLVLLNNELNLNVDILKNVIDNSRLSNSFFFNFSKKLSKLIILYKELMYQMSNTCINNNITIKFYNNINSNNYYFKNNLKLCKSYNELCNNLYNILNKYFQSIINLFLNNILENTILLKNIIIVLNNVNVSDAIFADCLINLNKIIDLNIKLLRIDTIYINNSIILLYNIKEIVLSNVRNNLIKKSKINKDISLISIGKFYIFLTYIINVCQSNIENNINNNSLVKQVLFNIKTIVEEVEQSNILSIILDVMSEYTTTKQIAKITLWCINSIIEFYIKYQNITNSIDSSNIYVLYFVIKQLDNNKRIIIDTILSIINNKKVINTILDYNYSKHIDLIDYSLLQKDIYYELIWFIINIHAILTIFKNNNNCCNELSIEFSLFDLNIIDTVCYKNLINYCFNFLTSFETPLLILVNLLITSVKINNNQNDASNIKKISYIENVILNIYVYKVMNIAILKYKTILKVVNNNNNKNYDILPCKDLVTLNNKLEFPSNFVKSVNLNDINALSLCLTIIYNLLIYIINAKVQNNYNLQAIFEFIDSNVFNLSNIKKLINDVNTNNFSNINEYYKYIEIMNCTLKIYNAIKESNINNKFKYENNNIVEVFELIESIISNSYCNDNINKLKEFNNNCQIVSSNQLYNDNLEIVIN